MSNRRSSQPRPASTTDDYSLSDDDDDYLLPMMPPDFRYTRESRPSYRELRGAYDYMGNFPVYSSYDWAGAGFDGPPPDYGRAIPVPASAAQLQGGVESDDLEGGLDGIRLGAFGLEELVTAGHLYLGYVQEAAGGSDGLGEGLDVDDDEEAYGGGGFGAVPASAASVATLETQRYGGGGAVNDGARCVICIEDFEVGEDLSVVPCSYRHRFHRSCLAEWLGRSRFCPLCRHALPAEGEAEVRRHGVTSQLGLYL